MTINEAIAKINSLVPNQYTDSDKRSWLNDCESMVMREIVNLHEGYADVAFTGYDDKTAPETVLLAPEPYSQMYIYYMAMQIHMFNQELDKYNNAASMFNTSYQNYDMYYNRNVMPLQKVTHFTL